MPGIRPFSRLLAAALCIIAAEGFGSTAEAQAIDTYYMLPLANGSNVVELSGSYAHFNSFQFSSGQKIPNTSLDEYSATFRYARYITIYGHPAGFQLIQPASYFTNAQFNGVNINDAPGIRRLGAGNTTLSAFFWPYANTAEQAYVFTAAYLAPPDGSYSRTNSFNAAYGGWQGDAQIGAVKGVGPNFSLQAAFDADFHGNEPLGFGARLGIDPIYRIQTWANWDWGSGLRTSIGYTGVFGGNWTTSIANTDSAVPRNAELQRVRAAAAYWWNPNVLTSLEVARDFEADGGYRLGIGTTAKLRLLF
jgi:hypothetical protein